MLRIVMAKKVAEVNLFMCLTQSRGKLGRDFGDDPTPQQLRVLRWIWNKVSVEDFFVPLVVTSKGRRMTRLARYPLNLKILFHVDLLLSLNARHCLIRSTLVLYPW